MLCENCGENEANVKYTQIINGVKKDKAFYYFTAVLRTMLGYRPVVYFGIIALFQMLCFTTIVRKYSPYLLTAFFIFFASTDYLSYMQNGIRQFIAACIIFLCSNLIFSIYCWILSWSFQLSFSIFCLKYSASSSPNNPFCSVK